jgi:hypothetical protein
MDKVFGELFSITSSDIELTIDGDIAVRNGDISLISDDDLQLQEIQLMFRERINPRDFMGYATSGNEGRAVGETIKEMILMDLQSNPTIDASNLVVDVYPLPDEKLQIDIARTYGNTVIPLTNGTLNFIDGTIEGMKQRQLRIADVYNEATSIDQKEIIVVKQYTNTIEIKHPLVTPESLMVFQNSDDAFDDNIIQTIEREFVNTDLTNLEINANDLFNDIDNTCIISSIVALNENGESINIAIDENQIITVTSVYGSDYNDIIIRVEYIKPIAQSVNQDIIENDSIIMIDQRMLFPYGRFFGKILVKLDTILDPGTYVVRYQRFALK